MGHARITVFSPRTETLNLALPFFLAGLSLCFLAAGMRFEVQSERVVLWLFSTLLFMNGTHSILTFYILYSLPEMRAFTLETRRSRRGLGLWGELGLVIGCYFVFFRALWPVLSENGLLFPMTLLGAIELHHGISQAAGVSTLYGQRLRREGPLAPDQERRLRRAEGREKILFGLLVVALFTATILHGRAGAWVWAGVGGCFAVVIAILFNSARMPGARKSNRVLYQARLLILPFTPVYFPVIIAHACVHGMEYFWIYRKMRAGSRAAAARGTAFAVAGCTLIFFFFAGAHSHPDRGFANILAPLMGSYSEILPWLSAMGGALTFGHFYADRRMFMMRDPLCRKHVAPLLAGEGAAAPVAAPAPAAEAS